MTEPTGAHVVKPDPDPTSRTVDLLKQSIDDIQRELTVRAEIRQREHANLQELLETKLVDQDRLEQEKFAGIGLQFRERDTRTTQAAETSQKALDAALLAAAALVNQQNEANATAATVQTLSFTKQIDQIIVLTERQQKSSDDRLAELKERIDRGDGSNAGIREVRVDSRNSTSQLLSAAVAFMFLAQLVIALVVVFKKP